MMLGLENYYEVSDVRKIVFDLDGAKATATMRDEVVPKACEAIWRKLPLSGMSIHAKWAAREFMLHLSGENRMILEQEGTRDASDIEIEGLGETPHFGAGQIFYFHREPGVLRGVQRDYAAEFQRELCELAIFYGHSGPSLQDPGRQPDPSKQVSIWFATFDEPIPRDFIARSDAMQYEGNKPLTVKRLQ